MFLCHEKVCECLMMSKTCKNTLNRSNNIYRVKMPSHDFPRTTHRVLGRTQTLARRLSCSQQITRQKLTRWTFTKITGSSWIQEKRYAGYPATRSHVHNLIASYLCNLISQKESIKWGNIRVINEMSIYWFRASFKSFLLNQINSPNHSLLSKFYIHSTSSEEH